MNTKCLKKYKQLCRRSPKEFQNSKMYGFFFFLSSPFNSNTMNYIHLFSFATFQARYYFQQLISGVFYCHSKVIKTTIYIYIYIYISVLGKYMQVPICRIIFVTFLCLLLTFSLISFAEGNMPQRSKAGEHLIGWKRSSMPENL